MSPKVSVQRDQQWLLHMQYVLYHTPLLEKILDPPLGLIDFLLRVDGWSSIKV